MKSVMKRKFILRVDEQGNIIRCDNGPESLTHEDEAGVRSIEVTQDLYDAISRKVTDFKVEETYRKIARSDGLKLTIPKIISRKT